MEVTDYAVLFASLIVSVAVNVLQYYRLKKAYRELKEMQNERKW
jgi:magnesium-transporting ATPase (P-type)